MALYSFTLFFSVFLILISKTQTTKRIALLIVGLLISILVGFRAEHVGVDTQAYFDIYNSIRYGTNEEYVSEYISYLYWLINITSAYFNGGASVVLFICSIIILYSLFITVLRFSKIVTLSLVIFFCFGPFFYMHNIVRQAVAVSIIFHSVSYVYSGERVKLLISFYVAFLFHMSVIFFVPFYFLSRIRMSIYFLLFTWVFSIFFVFNQSLIIGLFTLLSSYIPGTYSEYAGSAKVISNAGVGGVGLLLFFKQCLFILFLTAYSRIKLVKRKVNTFNAERYILTISLLSVILTNVLLGLAFVDRIIEYFYIFYILSIPLSVEVVFRKNVKGKYIFVLLLFVLLIFLFYRNLLMSNYSIIPYGSTLF